MAVRLSYCRPRAVGLIATMWLYSSFDITPIYTYPLSTALAHLTLRDEESIAQLR